MKVFGTVRFRLAIWNVVVIAVVLAIFGYSLQLKIRTDLLAGVDDSLNLAQKTLTSGTFHAFLMRHNITVDPASGINLPDSYAGPAATSTTLSPTPTALSIYPISVINTKGQTIYKNHPPMDLSALERGLSGDFFKSTVRYYGQPYRVFTVPYNYRGHVEYIVQFGRPLAQVYLEINRITRGLLTLVPLALSIVGIGALLLTERALRPVREIVRATEGIEASDLTGRLSERGTDEFSHLAATINNMLGRLEKAFLLLQDASEQQRRFTADASHELRTPLTIIKANTSLSLAVERTPDEYRRTLESVDRAADRMGKIVQDLLYIARSDAGQLFLKSDPVNLRSAVQQAIEAIADAKGHEIKQDGLQPGLISSGDEDALIRLFTNLLQNASNYTPQGGIITVSSYQEGGQNFVTVADTGIGIAPEHVEHLGERFFRVDNGRARDEGGSGLGLAICRSIAASHDGVLSIKSKLGKGTTVTVQLPSSESRTASGSGSNAALVKSK